MQTFPGRSSDHLPCNIEQIIETVYLLSTKAMRNIVMNAFMVLKNNKTNFLSGECSFVSVINISHVGILSISIDVQ